VTLHRTKISFSQCKKRKAPCGLHIPSAQTPGSYRLTHPRGDSCLFLHILPATAVCGVPLCARHGKPQTRASCPGALFWALGCVHVMRMHGSASPSRLTQCTSSPWPQRSQLSPQLLTKGLVLQAFLGQQEWRGLNASLKHSYTGNLICKFMSM
jgi:hypothetical protein